MDSALTALDLLAHDLRNKASVLISGARLLQGGIDAEDAPALGDDMYAAASDVARVIDRLIESARSELADGPGPRDEISVGELAAAGWARFRRSGPAGIDAASPFAGEQPLVSVHIQRCERVLADVFAAAYPFDPADARLTDRDAGTLTIGIHTRGEALDEPSLQLAKLLAGPAGVTVGQVGPEVRVSLPRV